MYPIADFQLLGKEARLAAIDVHGLTPISLYNFAMGQPGCNIGAKCAYSFMLDNPECFSIDPAQDYDVISLFPPEPPAEFIAAFYQEELPYYADEPITR